MLEVIVCLMLLNGGASAQINASPPPDRPRSTLNPESYSTLASLPSDQQPPFTTESYVSPEFVSTTYASTEPDELEASGFTPTFNTHTFTDNFSGSSPQPTFTSEPYSPSETSTTIYSSSTTPYIQPSTPHSTMRSTTSGYYSTALPPTPDPRCPEMEGDYSICITNCISSSNCSQGFICCPLNCGGGICVLPQSTTEMPQIRCPNATHGVSNRSAWLCEYIKWRIEFFGNWIKLFNQWRVQNSINGYMETPRQSCQNFQVTCSGPRQQRIFRDIYQCQIPYCADGHYKCGPGLAAWQADKILWSAFFNLWKKARNQQQNSN